ncbi:hypothetical protein HanLR1_Chr16g0607131 [Helianthus annuus]|nr:hypothetical protein HanHA89_Chr16g0646001 [Helianthus annuus]KAJ0639738.1 hypothetical protein HanLR1_Chr16g0607131 [Helianthus annuus]
MTRVLDNHLWKGSSHHQKVATRCPTEDVLQEKSHGQKVGADQSVQMQTSPNLEFQPVNGINQNEPK